MTNCCNDFGNCTQGKDCPIRKQRIKEINDAYINGHNDAQLGDPIDDLADVFKSVVIVAFSALAAWIAFLLFWGK